jgi:hypothetical protein
MRFGSFLFSYGTKIGIQAEDPQKMVGGFASSPPLGLRHVLSLSLFFFFLFFGKGDVA